MRGHPPALLLMYKTDIRQGHQSHFIFWWAPVSGTDFFRQYAYKRPQAIQVEGFRGERPGLTDTDPGIPQGGEQHMVTLVRHIIEEVTIRRSATAVAKSTPGAIGSRETRSGEFYRGMMLLMS